MLNHKPFAEWKSNVYPIHAIDRTRIADSNRGIQNSMVAGERNISYGPISFTLGLVFSTILTLLPGIFITGIGGIMLLVHALGFKSLINTAQ